MIARKKKKEDDKTMQINKKVLTSIFVIALLTLVLGYGTMSYYNVTVSATGNVFQSGTIGLTLAGDVPFVFNNIKPCDDLGPVTVVFQNTGDFDGYLYNKITYVNNDNAPNPTDLTADEFAALIYVKAVTYEHWSVPAYGGWGGINDDLPNWLGMDFNSDTFVSLYEIKQVGWMPYNDLVPEEPLPVGEGGRWNITFHMADSLDGHIWGDATLPDEDLLFGVLDNAPQADGIDMTWTAVLKTTSGPP